MPTIEYPAEFGPRVLVVKSWDGWTYHPECAAKRFFAESDPTYQRFPDPELVKPSSLLRSTCLECKKPMLPETQK